MADSEVDGDATLPCARLKSCDCFLTRRVPAGCHTAGMNNTRLPTSRPGVRWLAALTLAVIVLAGASCASSGDVPPPLKTEAAVDLKRFMGSWHVIANIPYWPERGKVATRDEYALREDGRIDNVYVFRTSFDAPEKRWTGVSSVVPGSNGAHWQVQFIWPLKTDLLVLEVAGDYSWALLGHPGRKYAWIFSRDSRMDAALYADLLNRMAGYGYDRQRIARIAQHADQVGQPGFQ
ncbi:MAG: lipocalin family protein [Xanthomonadaceae bacterium]|nr:lipocalin family protein [Xanthomonadaceae bacterium]